MVRRVLFRSWHCIAGDIDRAADDARQSFVSTVSSILMGAQSEKAGQPGRRPLFPGCSIDRIFLQTYVPKLQSVGQVCLFLHRQRGFPIPSSAAFGQIGEAYVVNEIQVSTMVPGTDVSSSRTYIDVASGAPGSGL